jgi:hypothetical protein
MRTALLLDLPSVRQLSLPNSSIQSARSPRGRSFRNPILQIELNLTRAIVECDSRHKVTSSKKRILLCQAIEDLANLSATFHEPLLTAVAKLTPHGDEKRILFKTAVRCDIITTAKDLSDVKEAHREINRKVAQQRAELEKIESATKEMEDEIEEMKRKLYNESDLFSRSRFLKTRIASLNAEFEAMFNPETVEQSDSVQELLVEREKNQKLLEKKRAEWEVVQQITKRVRFDERCLNDSR